MKGDIGEFSPISLSQKALECLQGNIASDKGLGRHIVFEFLKDTPGIREQSVIDFFATIKSCGEYAAIMKGDVGQAYPTCTPKAAEVLRGQIASYINPRRQPESDCSRDRDTMRQAFARRSRACWRES